MGDAHYPATDRNLPLITGVSFAEHVRLKNSDWEISMDNRGVNTLGVNSSVNMKLAWLCVRQPLCAKFKISSPESLDLMLSFAKLGCGKCMWCLNAEGSMVPLARCNLEHRYHQACITEMVKELGAECCPQCNFELHSGFLKDSSTEQECGCTEASLRV
eukprot:NODE_1154_length_593_cov_98.450368_g1080_i0.p1 GENE.NODE_1154_length_593_cov_98.450368_g1080_i0~~NODE_1154_length_593_cov_98.450368_g1080_i0.p1  ORF type:complete len:167 (-),score=34.32 NODE_1154_length_593_cov_98.450368_g1080_i0:93-569(-)